MKNQTEIAFLIDGDFAQELKRNLGIESDVELVRIALTALRWLADQKLEGRSIFSVDPSSTSRPHELCINELDAIRPTVHHGM